MGVRPPNARLQSEAAWEAKRRRTEVLRQLAAGELGFNALLALAMVDPAVSRMKALRALVALPSWGPRSAETALARAGIDSGRRLGYVVSPAAPQRVSRLLKLVDVGPGGRPPLAPGWPLWGRTDWVEHVEEPA